MLVDLNSERLVLFTVPSVFEYTYDTCACQRFARRRPTLSMSDLYFRYAFIVPSTLPFRSRYWKPSGFVISRFSAVVARLVQR